MADVGLAPKARLQGDIQLTQSLQNNDTLDMDVIWNVADSFKHAIIITRELDIESEAMALSRCAVMPSCSIDPAPALAGMYDDCRSCTGIGMKLASTIHSYVNMQQQAEQGQEHTPGVICCCCHALRTLERCTFGMRWLMCQMGRARFTVEYRCSYNQGNILADGQRERELSQ